MKITKDNLNFDAKGKEYVFVTCDPGVTQQLSVGDRCNIYKRNNGIVGYIVYTKIDTGKERAYEIAGMVAKEIENQTYSDVGENIKIVCRQANYVKLGLRDIYCAVSVKISYEAKYTNN